MKRVGNISVDGTKPHANASRHRTVSYKRVVELIKEVGREVEELPVKAKEAAGGNDIDFAIN